MLANADSPDAELMDDMFLELHKYHFDELTAFEWNIAKALL